MNVRYGVVAVTLAAGLLAAGCQAQGTSDGAEAASGRPGTSAAGAPGGSVGGDSAAGALGQLTVRPDGPIIGYDRLKEFGPAWTDSQSAPGGHNGCDTRDDVLRRDLTSEKLVGRCTVSSGTLADPYTGHTITFVRGRGTSAAVQIDHMVALGNAYRTGAASLPQATRVELANDPLNLTSADGQANEGKGDDDASAWLPANSAFRCAYVARQIAVKTSYQLSVSGAEKAAMTRVLNTCPGQALPTEISPGVALRP